jgi:hypothetical protein
MEGRLKERRDLAFVIRHPSFRPALFSGLLSGSGMPPFRGRTIDVCRPSILSDFEASALGMTLA